MRWSLLFLFCLGLTGCGTSAPADPREFGKVGGKVTIGGKPVATKGVLLVFFPDNGKKPTSVPVKEDGTYAGEAVVGANKVYVVPSVGADGAYLDPKKVGIAKKYLEEKTTTLKADVKGGDNTSDFEIGM